jgi:nitrite reductase/ring-hydroxylating ferredoxin subunit
MAAGERLICAADDLEEGGPGVRFEVKRGGERVPAFAIRWRGEVRAYLNRCGHLPAEMDWQPGEFFDFSRLYLICATHGALYDPADGACIGGPCNGRGLRVVAVAERDGNIYCEEP